MEAWIALSTQAARMCWEAQAVMLLRTMRIAKGGARAEAETQRMIAEKVAALVEAQIAATAATLIREAGSSQQAKAIEIASLQIEPNWPTIFCWLILAPQMR